jgi:hypothetical protein
MKIEFVISFMLIFILVSMSFASSLMAKTHDITISISYGHSNSMKTKDITISMSLTKKPGVKTNDISIALDQIKKTGVKTKDITFALDQMKKFAVKTNDISISINEDKKKCVKTNDISISISEEKKIGVKTNDITLRLFFPNVNIDGDKDGFFPPTDCNDDDANVHPGAKEICNGIDDDCSPATTDGSGETAPLCSKQLGVCSGARKTCTNGAWQDCNEVGYFTNNNNYEAIEASCDNLDNDCNGTKDGMSTSEGCNQKGECEGAIRTCTSGVPGACSKLPSPESCDGKDNDCDGEIDEGVKAAYYNDSDKDGFGNATVFVQSCSQPSGYIKNNTDCNDNNASINPAATEICNWVDDNCVNGIDENWVCDVKTPNATIQINDGEANTNTRLVSLHLGYKDELSGIQENGCRLSNDKIIWNDWEGCSPVKPWQLIGGDGKKTVYFEVRDNAGHVNSTNASINLQESGPSIDFKTDYDFTWTTQKIIQFSINCSGISGCLGFNYSYYNYNYTAKAYDYNMKKFIFAKSSAQNITDNVTCSNGVCKTNISIYAIDKFGVISHFVSPEFLIDLEEPEIESTKCTYPSGWLGLSKECTPFVKIPSGKELSFDAIANDSAGSGIKSISIFTQNLTSETQLSTSLTTISLSGRKEGRSTAVIKEAGDYNYKIVAEDFVGHTTSATGSFSVGGDPTKNCSSQNGTICQFYQVCGGDILDANDAHENVGITCCQGVCLNRSSLATCRLQGGEIYDYASRKCNGTVAPASDPIERNKCCKGTIVSIGNSIDWYDLSGNKLTGASKGDRVRCVGVSETENPGAYYNISIFFKGIKIKELTNAPINSTSKVEVGPIALSETGTYKCEGILVSSPPKKIVATLEIPGEETPITRFLKLLLYTHPVGMIIEEIILIEAITMLPG